MKQIMVSAFAILLCIATAQTGPTQGASENASEKGVARSLEAYQHGKKELSFQNLYQRALTQVRSATDEQVVGRAIRDLLETSKTLENTDDALEALDGLVRSKNIDTGDPIVRKAWLVRARMLLRQGEATAADSLFRTAIEKKWKAPDASNKVLAFRYYAEGLEEAERYADAAVLEYEVMTGPHNSVPDAEWNMMSYLFYRLWNLKLNKPDSSAMEDVYPRLADVPEHPEYQRIAKAFCLITDKRYAEAVALLEEIDGQLAEQQTAGKKKSYGEERNIPLYIAAAHFLDGGDLEAARAGLEEFWRRNKDRPVFVFNSTLVITHRLEKYPGGMEHRILSVTEFLVEKGFTSDSTIRAHIPEKDIAHLLAEHAHGLQTAGRIEEAKALCLEIIERYFPHNSAGVGALFIYGHIAWQEKDIEAACVAFQRIVDECNDTVSDDDNAEVSRVARRNLIDVLLLLDRPKQEILSHVKELRDATEPMNKHSVDNLEAHIRRIR